MTVRVLGRRFPAAATYVALLGAALLLLLATVAAAVWQAERQRETSESVRFSFEVRAQARQVLLALQGAESGQRGFLITSDANYLEPYRRAREVAEARIAALQRSAEAQPHLRPSVERVRDLTQRKFDELETTTGLAASGRRNEAILIVNSDVGLALMEDISTEIDGIVDREGTRLNAAITAAEEASLTLRLIVLLAALLLVAVGALLVVAVRGAMAELRASRDEAQASSERLAREIEARRQTEHKMVQMQKMEAIGQLTGGVAHDFNNMLAVIISGLTLMQRRIERGDFEVKQYLEGALDASRRASVLVSRLLAFARRQPLTPELIRPNQMVSGMSELLRRTLGEQIQLETVLAGGLWNAHADASQLENAIVNVCVNARDAMSERGGKLTIETANAYLDEDYAAANGDVKAGQYVMIAITDTGDGMTPEVIARAFEPFFTTKDVGKGTGLGLSHVHGFLKQSGGHVSIYSEVGHGTTVKLYLPRSHRAEETQAAPAAAADAPMGSRETLILVVEDDERVRAMSVASLKELGYSVIEAASGAAALRALSQHGGITLVFTDIVMPDMSGRALADEAKARFPGIKVLYTTGYTQNAIVHNGVVDADASLLMKPYSLEQMARKVRAVLES